MVVNILVDLFFSGLILLGFPLLHHDPLSVDGMPKLPVEIHRSADQPAAFNLAHALGIVKEILDPLSSLAGGALAGVIVDGTCHASPSCRF
jgi:hypothetical protein